ncbi:MAG: SpoIIE family protein phosphatase [Lachnospiraceae bacterium]|nr:SpoIIE family protein phosphatase [Lachnospiraceae bacterium]
MMIGRERYQRGDKRGQALTLLPNYGKKRLLDYADSFRDIAKTYMAQHGELGITREEQRKKRETGDASIEKQNIVYQQKISENREILADHLTEMAELMTEVAEESFHLISMSHKKQKQIIQILKSHGILVQTIYMIQQKSGQIEVSIMMRSCKSRHFEIDDIAGVLSVLLNRRFIPDKNCVLYLRDIPDIYVFQEETKYGIFTGIAKAIKENESMSGDNYSLCDMSGSYLCAISDGMGSGEKAYEASAMVINLLEKLLEAGFESDRAIRMINGALIANGEECNTSTLDLCRINLSTGLAVFWKTGAAVSYIKRANGVEILEGDSLPLGIFHQLDISSKQVQLREGDYVIMVSDGVLDAFRDNDAAIILQEFIETIELENPREIANYILQYVIHFAGGNIRDDMTIEVAGLYKNKEETAMNG